MNKRGIVLILEDREQIKNNYFIFLEMMFSKVLTTYDFKEAISMYLHYKPDVILIGNGAKRNEYDKFLKKILHTNIDLFLCCTSKDKDYLSNMLEYNFVYCELPTEFRDVFLTKMDSSPLPNKNFNKELILNKDFRKSYLDSFYNPSLICSYDKSLVECNLAFNDFFDISSQEIKDALVKQEFINHLFLEDVTRNKSLIQEHTFKIMDKEIKGKVFILEKWKTYLIIFPVISVNELNLTKLKKHFKRMLTSFNQYSATNNKVSTLRDEFYDNFKFRKEFGFTNELIYKWINEHKSFIQYCDEEFNFEALESLELQSSE